jgi:hypothetical protein
LISLTTGSEKFATSGTILERGCNVDAATAIAHGGVRMIHEDKFVTKDFVDARFAEVRTKFYRALLVQAVGVVGLFFAMWKLF